MFLDTSGAAGGPWEFEEPPKPIKSASKDWILLLSYVALMIFFGACALAAHLTGQNGIRDGLIIIMVCATDGALCLIGWIVLKVRAAKLLNSKK